MQARRFKIPNLRSFILAHRAELLIDALTIIKAYGRATVSTETAERIYTRPLVRKGRIVRF